MKKIRVGVYYYPWYGSNDHTIKKSLRMNLDPPQVPFLDDYNSRDEKVISEHIEQSIRGNIDFWVCSWWGPDKYEDKVFREHILKHPNSGRLKYGILYETEGKGRLGDQRNPNYENFLDEFLYLSNNYFNNENYLKINGRPVVFIYLTRVYFRNQGIDELSKLRDLYPDLYLVGDDVFNKPYKPNWAKNWDAITAYDVYGQSLENHGSTEKALSVLKEIYCNAKYVANIQNVKFIPAATPGFNDKILPNRRHKSAPRYLTDSSKQIEGSLFEKMLNEIVLPYSDSDIGNIIMITSFNEWHEDTQIEATSGKSKTTQYDNSSSKKEYNEGNQYSDYGYLYLDILKKCTKN